MCKNGRKSNIKVSHNTKYLPHSKSFQALCHFSVMVVPNDISSLISLVSFGEENVICSCQRASEPFPVEVTRISRSWGGFTRQCVNPTSLRWRYWRGTLLNQFGWRTISHRKISMEPHWFGENCISEKLLHGVGPLKAWKWISSFTPKRNSSWTFTLTFILKVVW